MIRKLIITGLFIFIVSFAFCQAAIKDSIEKLSQASSAKDSAFIIKDNDKAHATLNTNTGTSVASTTSGTMNSSVNPNSQVIIPFGQKKKKTVTPAASVVTDPKN